MAFPHWVSLHFLWETPSLISHWRHFLNELRTAFTPRPGSLSFLFTWRLTVGLWRWSQGTQKSLYYQRQNPQSLPLSCGASPPATTPFSPTHSSMHSSHKHNSGLPDGLGIYKLIEVDTRPEATPTGVDQSTVDRQQQQSNKNTPRGSSGLRVHREGAENLLGSFPRLRCLSFAQQRQRGRGILSWGAT